MSTIILYYCILSAYIGFALDRLSLICAVPACPFSACRDHPERNKYLLEFSLTCRKKSGFNDWDQSLTFCKKVQRFLTRLKALSRPRFYEKVWKRKPSFHAWRNDCEQFSSLPVCLVSGIYTHFFYTSAKFHFRSHQSNEYNSSWTILLTKKLNSLWLLQEELDQLNGVTMSSERRTYALRSCISEIVVNEDIYIFIFWWQDRHHLERRHSDLFQLRILQFGLFTRSGTLQSSYMMLCMS